MKVVIDTNILIDGSVDDYNFGNQIIEAVIDGRIDAFANRSTLKENKLIVGRKIEDEEYRAKLEEYFDKVQSVAFGDRLDVVEDKEDNKLVESAVAAHADYLITSDKHLLKLEKYGTTIILSPSRFWQEFEEEVGEGWGKWVDNFMK